MKSTNRVVLLAIAACLAAASFSHAITIPYGDFNGDTVMYLAVTEDTFSQPNALFGQPAIQGDVLDFDPTDFFAEVNSSTGTSASETVDGQLDFTIMSIDPSNRISHVVIREAGDYTLAGLGSAAMAEVTVSTPVRYTVTEVNGAPITPIVGLEDLVFTPGDSFSLPPAGSGSWDGLLNIDLDSIAPGATKVEIMLVNTLTAEAANGGSAFIAKKDFSGVTITIPEPNALGLMVLATLAMIGFHRQR